MSDPRLTSAQEAALYSLAHPPMNGLYYMPEEIELAFMAGTIFGLTEARNIITPEVQS